jgi:ATP-binding cassette subfamily B protein
MVGNARNQTTWLEGFFQAMRSVAAASDGAGRRWFATALILVTIGAGSAGLAPLALKAIIDASNGAGRHLEASRGIELALAYVAALGVQRMCEQLQAYAYGKGEQRLLRRFTGRAFEHLLRLPLAIHLDEKSGAVTQGLTEAAVGVRLICTHAVITISPLLVQLAVAVVVLASVFGAAGAAALGLAILVYAAVFAWGVTRLALELKAISSAQAQAGGAIADALMNVETIKAFTAERRFAGLYDCNLAQTERAWGQFMGARLQNGLLVAAVFCSLIGASLIGTIAAVQTGALSLGGVVLVNTYALQLVRPLEMVGFAVRDVSQGYAYIERLMAMLRIAPEGAGALPAPPPPEPLPPQPQSGPAELAFDQVSFSFGPGRPALSDVSFTASPGEVIGIVGPSGAGKSSLVRLALRFYESESGQVRLDGRPSSAWPLEAWRQQIALVSQDTILFNDTIAANIGFAREDASDLSIEQAASSAKLDPLLARLPERLQTRVGERGLKLSGGEKQRVSIARAALKQARLVIFDEATSALDPATEQAVWQAMRYLAARATTLVVTHRLATVAAADRIMVLDQGRIVETGPHRALLAAKGLYWRLWRAQDLDARSFEREASASLTG